VPWGGTAFLVEVCLWRRIFVWPLNWANLSQYFANHFLLTSLIQPTDLLSTAGPGALTSRCRIRPSRHLHSRPGHPLLLNGLAPSQYATHCNIPHLHTATDRRFPCECNAKLKINPTVRISAWLTLCQELYWIFQVPLPQEKESTDKLGCEKLHLKSLLHALSVYTV
jgi:hypothetical protein